MQNLNQFDRRRFLQASTAAGALLITGTRTSFGVEGANNRVRIAVIGLNGRGKDHIKGWQKADNVEIAYLVDPDSKVLASAMANLEKSTDGKFTTKGVADLRTVSGR